jgi:hypothetical protein
MVVVVEPLREGLEAFLVRPIEPDVRPLPEQCLDEALRLAIRLRAIPTRDRVARLEGAERLMKDRRQAIG